MYVTANETTTTTTTTTWSLKGVKRLDSKADNSVTSNRNNTNTIQETSNLTKIFPANRRQSPRVELKHKR
jgi:hypothetical protein